MLAAQLVACHNLAMSSLKQAASGPPNLADGYLNRAQKLMAAFSRSLEALNRHRGKGSQRIVVERIDVRDGGQAAIVMGDRGRK
jgi:hypothetical protein